jgi:hypothetical protein
VRSPAHNRAVGGAPNSFHLSGRAIDIARRPGVRHAQVDAAFRKAGFVLLESLDEGDHSHLAFRMAGDPGPVPARRVSVRFAAAAPAEPACGLAEPGASAKRRRPDRAFDCDQSIVP